MSSGCRFHLERLLTRVGRGPGVADGEGRGRGPTERERTEDAGYAERLVGLQQVWWKRWLNVQWPYHAHLRRMRLGRVLEVGCGIGRNLVALGRDGAVGVDHNERAVAIARGRGLVAYAPADFRASPLAAPGSFDALLLSHVLEHMSADAAVNLLREYLPCLRRGGGVVIITPQEAGFRSDPTHVAWLDLARVRALLAEVGLEPVRSYSFPFPRRFGRSFKYNEFVTIARKVTD